MQSSQVIATHPYLGDVTAENWALLFHPLDARADIAYRVILSTKPTAEHYQAFLPRLPAFEAFCRNLPVNTEVAQAHFRAWPASAGQFELIAVLMDGDPEGLLPWSTTPYPYQQHPFALQYRALSSEAWEYAGINSWPPQFAVLFDENGAFAGVEYNVEQAMQALPDTITRSRWQAGYKHPHFGRRKLSDFDRLVTVTVGGRKIKLDLWMTKKTMAAFEPEQLDPFVPLARDIAGLDAQLRATFPENLRKEWLEDRFEYDEPSLRNALERIFPGATSPDNISHRDFTNALVLQRGCFSLDPDKTDGSLLTLDYRILPDELDNYLFAATFGKNGELMDVVIES